MAGLRAARVTAKLQRVPRKYQERTGRRIRDDGYVDIWAPGHPIARRDGYVFEHRKMAYDAGLLVNPSDEVHHVNEIRDDNRLANFEVLPGAEHAKKHLAQNGYVRNQYGQFPLVPPERRPGPKPERNCAHCKTRIPESLRRDARYCSSYCRMAAWKAAHRRTVGMVAAQRTPGARTPHPGGGPKHGPEAQESDRIPGADAG